MLRPVELVRGWGVLGYPGCTKACSGFMGMCPPCLPLLELWPCSMCLGPAVCPHAAHRCCRRTLALPLTSSVPAQDDEKPEDEMAQKRASLLERQARRNEEARQRKQWLEAEKEQKEEAARWGVGAHVGWHPGGWRVVLRRRA